MQSQVPDRHDRSGTPAVDSTAGAPGPLNPSRERERGAALVEFALVLPILAVMLFGMIEFGRAINYWIDATHLAQRGGALGGREPEPRQHPDAGADAAAVHPEQGDDRRAPQRRHGWPYPPESPVKICFPSGRPPSVSRFVRRQRLRTTGCR